MKPLSKEELAQEQNSRVLPYSVCCYNLVRDFNLASALRNSCIFAATKFFILGSRQYDRRGTVGAHHYVDVEVLKDIVELTSHPQVNRLIGLEVESHISNLLKPHQQFYNINSFEWEAGDCILFGQEGLGILEEHIPFFDCFVTIPQYGIMRSLNTATASGIAMQAAASYFSTQ